MSVYTGMAGCAQHVIIDNPPNDSTGKLNDTTREMLGYLTYAVYALAIACTAGVIVLAAR